MNYLTEILPRFAQRYQGRIEQPGMVTFGHHPPFHDNGDPLLSPTFKALKMVKTRIFRISAECQIDYCPVYVRLVKQA